MFAVYSDPFLLLATKEDVQELIKEELLKEVDAWRYQTTADFGNLALLTGVEEYIGILIAQKYERWLIFLMYTILRLFSSQPQLQKRKERGRRAKPRQRPSSRSLLLVLLLLLVKQLILEARSLG